MMQLPGVNDKYYNVTDSGSVVVTKISNNLTEEALKVTRLLYEAVCLADAKGGDVGKIDIDKVKKRIEIMESKTNLYHEVTGYEPYGK